MTKSQVEKLLESVVVMAEHEGLDLDMKAVGEVLWAMARFEARWLDHRLLSRAEKNSFCCYKFRHEDKPSSISSSRIEL